MMGVRDVLVGFDASPAAERALCWAAAEASLRGVPLRVCHAWSWHYPARPEDEDALKSVRTMGAATLQEGVRIARETVPGLDVRPLLVKGSPSGALLEASVDASLVVIGARGRRLRQPPARIHCRACPGACRPSRDRHSRC